MDWFIFAFVATIFWAVGVVIDKYILTKHMQDPFTYQLLYTITESPVMLLLLFTSISSALPWSLLGIVGGLGIYPGIILYFKAMAIEETSRVISLWYTSSIFVLLLAYVFLGEKLNLPSYLGVLSLVLGAMIISYRKEKGKKPVISPALGLILASGLIFAGYEILTKYVLNAIDYVSYLFWNFVGTSIVGLSLFCVPKIRGIFLSDIKRVNRTALFWRIVNTSMSLIGTVLYYIAISSGPVSLVSAASSLEPFFVFVIILLLSLFVPRILKEEMGKRAILIKALSIILIVIGTWLITK
ncbi:MAG: EamA family transporter [Candidatus Bathyarchaeota archaeon]|nr:MAG: EamA family transporter [Candidatus Bathyarchaeota archaeon]